VTTGGGVTILTVTDVMIINKVTWEDRGEETMKTIKVKGMSCDHCVKAVTSALKAIEGIDHVKVSLEASEATFEETTPVDMSVIKEKIRKAGFDVG
jgi:copper chaperone